MYNLTAVRANSTEIHRPITLGITRTFKTTSCIDVPHIWMQLHLSYKFEFFLQLKIICYFRCSSVLKGNRCPGYSLEAEPTEGQP